MRFVRWLLKLLLWPWIKDHEPQPESTNMKPVREWLVEFGLAKDMDEADHLCFTGSIRLDGNIFMGPYHLVRPGSILSAVTSDYTFAIPDRSNKAVLREV